MPNDVFKRWFFLCSKLQSPNYFTSFSILPVACKYERRAVPDLPGTRESVLNTYRGNELLKILPREPLKHLLARDIGENAEKTASATAHRGV